jgi:hypothetical protein
MRVPQPGGWAGAGFGVKVRADFNLQAGSMPLGPYRRKADRPSGGQKECDEATLPRPVRVRDYSWYSYFS